MEMLNTGTELIESAHKVLLTSQRKIQNINVNRADLRTLRQTLNEGLKKNTQFILSSNDFRS